MIKEVYEQLKSEVLKQFLETDDIKLIQNYNSCDTEYYVSIQFELEGIQFYWLLKKEYIICIDSHLNFTDEETELIAKKVTKMIENNPVEFEKFKLIKSLIGFNN